MFYDSDFEIEHYDDETGEILMKPTATNPETGELEAHHLPAIPSRNVKTKPFRIPTTLKKPADHKTKSLKNYQPPQDSSLICGTAILYLLPTTIFFYPILSIVLVAFEVILHVWAHKKNKSLKDKNLSYRSPLHVICKEFCASCKDMEARVKIKKIQDRRNDKIQKYGLEYVRRIVT